MLFFSWGLFHDPEAILFCTFIYLAVCGPCSTNGLQSSLEHDARSSYKVSSDVELQDGFGGDLTSRFLFGNVMPQQVVQDVCTNSNSFCFPSTLHGFLSEEHNSESIILGESGIESETIQTVGLTQGRSNLSWSSDFSILKLSSGRAVSCSLNFFENFPSPICLQTDGCKQNDVSYYGERLDDRSIPIFFQNENAEKTKSVPLDAPFSHHAEISPPLLDWGEKYLYFPSLAYLMVKNTHSDRVLVIYKPYSTNSQFYPCDTGGLSLGPGESASICFVFLPLWLGLSSAELILQTSSGGFFIQARGFGIESADEMQPILGLDDSSTGRQSKNLSLFNPFDETLYVEEVTAWISMISENISHSSEITCSIGDIEDSDELGLNNVKEWLDVRNSLVDLPLMSIRLHRNWEIGAYNSRTLMELDFSHYSKGKIFGAVCMKWLRSSKDKVDVVTIPLEAELGEKLSSVYPMNPVSVSFEPLMLCDTGGTALRLSLRNDASYLLRIVKISVIGESTKFIRVKYMQGLFLFPGSVTQVAVITYTPAAIQSLNSLPEITDSFKDCKFLILTNDSSSPQLEVPCSDLAAVCARGRFDTLEHECCFKSVRFDALRKELLDSSIQSPSQGMALYVTEADESVLRNWKSQATARGVSVLNDHEILFPTVQVGSHHSEWITVKNPSSKPVVMQLILNSGEIIDECRAHDGLLHPPLPTCLVSNKSKTPLRYGFSIAESAVTEAYLYPFGAASFGPILFHPSNRCGWRSSALVRNNLTGVEWLPLRGFGGALSLVLFEGSEDIQILEFKYSLLSSLNLSSPHMMNPMEEKRNTCCQPLLKEIYAKNVGDLALSVKKIEVSGAKCELDGFSVHPCNGFALEPGESMRLVISYQSDFSSATVQRDLELALANGILTIPMKASVPIYTLSFCKKFLFWKHIKRSLYAILLVSSIMILVFYCILPYVVAFGSRNYFFRREKFSTINRRHDRKSSHLHLNHKNSKLVGHPKLSGLLRSVEEDKLSLGSIGCGRAVTHGIASTTVQGEPVFSGTYVNVNSECLKGKTSLSDETATNNLPSSCPKSPAAKGYVTQETSPSENLTVKIGKDKGQRRRKKKSSSAVLAGAFELSSSHSGNSTPSSPLSPITSYTTKQSWPHSFDVDQAVESGNVLHVSNELCERSSVTGPVSNVNEMEPGLSQKQDNDFSFPIQQRSSTPDKYGSSGDKLLLSASPTFPNTCRPASTLISPSFQNSAPAVDPLARAPGSKLHYHQKVMTVTDEKNGMVDEFKYDIWGNHLFGLDKMGRSSEAYKRASHLKASNSNSFFVRSPQTLVTKSQLESVSCNQEEL